MSAPCPVCGSLARLVADHPEAFIHRCPDCTHCFSVLKESAGREEYDDRYYEHEHRRWFANPNIKLFSRIAEGVLRERENLSVLDVGCGRGDFLRYLRRTYPGLTLTGIELTELPPVAGIQFLKGDVLTTDVDGSFGEFLARESSFDVVVSLAVIEHIPDVRSFARRLVELCRPGGVICVMTVNEASVLYALARALRKLGLPLAFDRLYKRHHVHHFTTKSLAELFRREHVILERAFTNNGMLAATDIPASSRLVDAALRGSVGLIMVVGWACRQMYLQTAFYRKPENA